jgi:acetyltransferase-like isoleucine patch superfamily enzyme
MIQALWTTAPGRCELRTETLPPRAPDQALVRTTASGISRGTERLVLMGRVPESQYATMRCPLQQGDFPFPVKYGYSAVGVVEDGAIIHAFTHLEGAIVRAGATAGPYARLRPKADLGPNSKVGNFVEIKAAQIGAGAKISHLSYIGDASVGADANIGAGTITCNYDGFNKARTEIGEGAFVGSNSSLVAPVRIGAGAYVGSGSVITQDVAPDGLALSRAPQIEKAGWAALFRALQANLQANRPRQR